ncbi:MAG: peptidoglycan recognition family protein [Roseiflexaceae bacterium]
MRRALLLIGLVAALGGALLPLPRALVAQTGAPVQIGELVLTSVLDWQAGTRENVLVSNNADGEARLDDTTKRGVFTSPISQTGLLFNALGATWQADVPAGSQLQLEVRVGPAADQLGAWQTLAGGDAQSQKDGARALESLLATPPDSAAVQFRATFTSTVPNAAPVLSELRLYPINALSGPSLSAGLTRAPALSGPATRTPAPLIIPREVWGLAAPQARLPRQTPRGIVLHQIGGALGDNPLPYLRALAAYDTQTLGWDDLPFHYIIDQTGNIFEGAAGGPTAAVPRLAGGDEVVQIALLDSGAIAQSTLVRLLAWLGEAYGIAPLGQHQVERPAQGAPATRPNIAAHADIVPEASDPGPELRQALDTLRQAADQATVRSRWYFAEGNTLNYQERLAVLNPGSGPASVRFRLLRQPGPAQERTVTLGAGERFDLTLNTIFSDTTDVPAVIEANAPVIAERYMDFGADIDSGPGVTQPARVWYFAEGTTDGGAQTYLLLFNPQSETVNATVTYMKGDGTTQEQGEISIPPGRRVVVTVADTLPGVGFGARVIASQPIVAERTMVFGADSGADTGGFHNSPGVVSLSRRWYFAEGTTQAPFRMGVLVLNPNAQRANVAVTFLTPSGTYITRNYAVPPTTRLAIDVNEVVPDLGVATTVESDRPVAAERALYWNDGRAGSVSVGATDLAYTWRFADGRTTGEFQTYLLFSNPGAGQARVAVEFVLANGQRQTQAIVLAGRSRYTMAVHQLLPGQQALAATVRSTQPIVVERAIYPGAPGSPGNRGGATSLGIAEK